MDAREIVEALGGREAVAKAAGVEVASVVSWEWRGFIPGRKIAAVAKLIRPRCRVTTEMLLALTVAKKPRRAVQPRRRAETQPAQAVTA